MTDEQAKKIVREGLLSGLNQNGIFRRERALDRAFFDRIQDTFVMNSVEDGPFVKRIIGLNIKKSIDDIKEKYKNFNITYDEALIDEIFSGYVSTLDEGENSARRIASLLKNEIENAFARAMMENKAIIKSNTNINTPNVQLNFKLSYESTAKELKITLSNE